jgi:outer membrane protein
MMNASRKRAVSLQILIVLGFLVSSQTLVLLTAGSAFAQAQQKTQSSQTQSAELSALPDSPVEKAQQAGTALPLSLKDLTKLALLNNLDIAISDTNEELVNQRLNAAFGSYDPTLTASWTYTDSKSPNTNLSTASTTDYNQMMSHGWNSQFQQAIRATGGTFSARVTGGRSDNNQVFSLFTPQYNAGMTFSFTQPLLQNRKIDQNRMNIKLINLDIKTNDSTFRQQVNEIIASVQTQYWELVSAIEKYRISQESVNLARITLQNNQKKVAIGTLAPLEVTMAESSLASREVELIAAEEAINTVQNTVRNLVSKERDAEIWSKFIVPTDSPEFKERKLDLNQAIDTALKNRPELEQQDIKLMQSDLSFELYQNSKKWKLDAIGSFGSNGVAGPQSYNQQGKPNTPESLVGGAFTAYKLLFTGGYINWAVGVNVTIPLRTRSLDSQIAQNRITKQQYLMQRKKQEQAILVEVRNAVSRLETLKRGIEQTKVAARYAKEQMEGEQKRFEAGLSNNFLVLDAQDKLSSAQYQQLAAIIAYQKAVISAEKSMYTLLESNDFKIAKGSGETVPDFK